MRALALAVGATLAFVFSAGPGGGACDELDLANGECFIDPATGELVVGGSLIHPGIGPAEPGAGEGEAIIAAPNPEAERAWRAYLQALHDRCIDMGEDPAECPPPPPPPGEPLDPVTQPVDPIMLSDLAAFRPLVGELVVEPDGWGVVGTPTNFYATAQTHTMTGQLFDVPIEVRWTPTSYVFDYGDGTSETSTASGSPWRGPEESWTETTTSHTYASRDDVTASLTVVFTAEVDAGGGWFPVPGTLPVAAPSVGVKIFEVGTVLTNGDCMANPTAAGCGG